MCVCMPIRESVLPYRYADYTAVQSTTFNYVCEWIWGKVNCSVRQGNGLFDVWALITWHFYYSTRREEWRDEEEEERRRTEWRYTFTSERDHHWEYVYIYNRLSSCMVRRVLIQTSLRTPASASQREGAQGSQESDAPLPSADVELVLWPRTSSWQNKLW